MSERSEAAGQGPAAGARSDGLQPQGRPTNDLGAPLRLTETLDGIPADEADQARRLEENLARRQGDQRLVEALRAQDFDGRHYYEFKNELARYGLSILRGWMYTGTVFRLLADRRFLLKPTEAELEELHTNSDAREDLASMTVGMAMPAFREKALIEGGWDVDGGASLTTYFGGALLYVFPNVYRSWRAQRLKWQRQDGREHIATDLERGPVTDPGVLVAGDAWCEERMSAASTREREMVQLRLAGYSFAEIAEMVGEERIRAVEGVLYRWRQSEAARIAIGEGG